MRVLRGGTLLVLQHERLRHRVRVARWLRVRERSGLGRDGVPACLPHEMIQLLRSLRVCSALSHAW